MADAGNQTMAQRVAAGDRRAIARLITLLESGDASGVDALRALQPRLGRAHVVGVTGSPGTGKSTLTDRLIQEARRQGRKVGVVAVDPSSPFTGGAILGDRIRMQHRSTDPGVFIRSMGTRGSLGGLSSATSDAVKVLDAAGYDLVLVETVGVGQAEVDIVRFADTVLVVLVPNLGDDVQAVKAGLMEIADVFVVNKCDLIGADKVAAEVEANLMLAHPEEGHWTPPIHRTVAERGQGVPELLKAVDAHREWAQRTGAWQARRSRRAREEVRMLLRRAVEEHAFGEDGRPRPQYAEAVARAERGETAPHDVVADVLAGFRAS